MFTPKKIAQLAVALGIAILGVQTARGFFEIEKLYPIENIKIEPPKISATEPTNAANPFLPLLKKSTTTQRPAADIVNLAAKFDARNLEISLLASAPQLPATEVENCKSLIETALTMVPENLTTSLDEMKLFFSDHNPRGLSNSHLVELRCSDLADTELVSVAIHELGHVVDLGKLKGNSLAPSGFVDGEIQIAADDPSVKFYRLSWRSEMEKNYLAERRDFVSGYAMTDPFEDFAESFNFYVLHGADFRAIKSESRVLAAKYNFLKNTVFAGVEFDSGRATTAGKRVWDTTLVDFDLAKFKERG
ncbi:MAG: hypothetical protein V2A63_01445 [Patescibacteria group bacterium]